MSQYHIVLNNDNEFLYGFDAPTGGFFYSIIDKEDEEIDGNDGLTLTELNATFVKYYIKGATEKLVSDFEKLEKPSNLQTSVAKLFGKNVEKMLEDVRKDIVKNWSK